MILVRRLDGGRSGAGSAAARALAAEVLGIDAADVVLSAVCPDCGGPHGRPVVHSTSGDPLPAWVSIAHSAGSTWVAVTNEGEIGVDVEPLDQPAERLASIAALTGSAGDPRELLERWTRVEAVLKADGRGLRVDPAAVRLSSDGATVADSRTRYRFVDAEQPAGAVLGIAIRLPD